MFFSLNFTCVAKNKVGFAPNKLRVEMLESLPPQSVMEFETASASAAKARGKLCIKSTSRLQGIRN